MCRFLLVHHCMLPLISRTHLLHLILSQIRGVSPVEGSSEVYFWRMLARISHHLLLNQNSKSQRRRKDLLGHQVFNCLRRIVMEYPRIRFQGMIHSASTQIRWRNAQGVGIGQIVVSGLHFDVLIIHMQVMNICHHLPLNLPKLKILLKVCSLLNTVLCLEYFWEWCMVPNYLCLGKEKHNLQFAFLLYGGDCSYMWFVMHGLGTSFSKIWCGFCSAFLGSLVEVKSDGLSARGGEFKPTGSGRSSHSSVDNG